MVGKDELPTGGVGSSSSVWPCHNVLLACSTAYVLNCRELANWAGYGWDTAGSVEDMLRLLAGLCTTSTVGHHLTEGLTETNKTGFRNVSEVLSCKG